MVVDHNVSFSASNIFSTVAPFYSLNRKTGSLPIKSIASAGKKKIENKETENNAHQDCSARICYSNDIYHADKRG